MRAQSRAASASAGTIHEPPTVSTFGKARYAGARLASIPPVGQKRACANGPANDFNAPTPPALSAGKNLNTRWPCSNPRINSLAVAIAGIKAQSMSRAAVYKASVAPGAIANAAPASCTACMSLRVSTVPAPTTAAGTSRAMRAMASSAHDVRNVTSSTGKPPATSARASGTASSMSAMANTGNAGARRRMDSMVASCRFMAWPGGGDGAARRRHPTGPDGDG